MCVCLDFSNQFSFSLCQPYSFSFSLSLSLCVFSFNNNFMHNFALFYWPSFALCNVFLYLFNSLGLVSWLLACLRWRWWCWQLYLNLTLARIFFAFWQIHLQRLLIHFVFAYLIDVKLYIYINFICILFGFFHAFSVIFHFICVNFILFYFACILSGAALKLS